MFVSSVSKIRSDLLFVFFLSKGPDPYRPVKMLQGAFSILTQLAAYPGVVL
mgnify:CR=1 FL=1